MKMYLYLDALSLYFFHRFYFAAMVSGVRFQVSGVPPKADRRPSQQPVKSKEKF
ncbi:hypothetical protein D1AOALGA4SA_8871 [Olavius algarvensis Delta 1 endosymbiont]|nr:hypothetical protein D1AOALGA4SA_8871 [Olavius algarvensis Delta 1 endosymbiont]